MQHYRLCLKTFIHTNLPQAGFELESPGLQAIMLPIEPRCLFQTFLILWTSLRCFTLLYRMLHRLMCFRRTCCQPTVVYNCMFVVIRYISVWQAPKCWSADHPRAGQNTQRLSKQELVEICNRWQSQKS